MISLHEDSEVRRQGEDSEKSPSVPLSLCVNFITETQSFLHPPLLLCPSALKFFYRRVEIHFLILSILLILSKRETLGLSVKIILSQSSIDAKTQSLPHAVSHLLPSSQCLCASVPLCLKQRGPSAVFRFIRTF